MSSMFRISTIVKIYLYTYVFAFGLSLWAVGEEKDSDSKNPTCTSEKHVMCLRFRGIGLDHECKAKADHSDFLVQAKKENPELSKKEDIEQYAIIIQSTAIDNFYNCVSKVTEKKDNDDCKEAYTDFKTARSKVEEKCSDALMTPCMDQINNCTNAIDGDQGLSKIGALEDCPSFSREGKDEVKNEYEEYLKAKKEIKENKTKLLEDMNKITENNQKRQSKHEETINDLNQKIKKLQTEKEKALMDLNESLVKQEQVIAQQIDEINNKITGEDSKYDLVLLNYRKEILKIHNECHKEAREKTDKIWNLMIERSTRLNQKDFKASVFHKSLGKANMSTRSEMTKRRKGIKENCIKEKNEEIKILEETKNLQLETIEKAIDALGVIRDKLVQARTDLYNSMKGQSPGVMKSFQEQFEALQEAIMTATKNDLIQQNSLSKEMQQLQAKSLDVTQEERDIDNRFKGIEEMFMKLRGMSNTKAGATASAINAYRKMVGEISTVENSCFCESTQSKSVKKFADDIGEPFSCTSTSSQNNSSDSGGSKQAQ